MATPALSRAAVQLVEPSTLSWRAQARVEAEPPPVSSSVRMWRRIDSAGNTCAVSIASEVTAVLPVKELMATLVVVKAFTITSSYGLNLIDVFSFEPLPTSIRRAARVTPWLNNPLWEYRTSSQCRRAFRRRRRDRRGTYRTLLQPGRRCT